MSQLPQELVKQIISNLSGSNRLDVCKSCKLYYAKYYDFAILKIKLERSVYTSKPFFPQELKSKTPADEKQIYNNGYEVNIFIKEKLIGCITYMRREIRFWMCRILASNDFVDMCENTVNPKTNSLKNCKYNKVDKLESMASENILTFVDHTNERNNQLSLCFPGNVVIMWEIYCQNLAFAECTFWKVWAVINQP